MSGSVVTRAVTITYAGLTLGEGTPYDITGALIHDTDKDAFGVSFEVVIDEANGATLTTRRDALRAAIKTPNADLVVTVNGEIWITASHSGSTGFNARGDMRTLPEHQTELSAGYAIDIVGQLPALEAGKAGRRESRVRLTRDAVGIATIEISAVYTAQAGEASATAQALDEFPGFVTAAKARFGSLQWEELAGIDVSTDDDEDKIAAASQAFREQVLPQSQLAPSGLIDPILKLPKYRVRTLAVAGRSSREIPALPMIEVEVRFETGILRASEGGTDDLKGAYQQRVYPWLLQLAQAKGQPGGAITPLAEDVDQDSTNNNVFGVVRFLAPADSVVESQVSRLRFKDEGENLEPVADGSAYRRDLMPGPKTKILQTTIRTVEVFGSGGKAYAAAVRAELSRQRAQGYRLQTQSQVEADGQYRIPGLDGELEVAERAGVFAFEYAELDQVTGGGGGSTGNNVGSTMARTASGLVS